ncbi:PEPxxWA-CTERM sorting domain-containing protein [Sphingomonas sp. RB3P16]|uniref:PEPxxWA-CTERM sorting domain-containing protein n=1 Tax=Parasphingomonas frigoris TaxID=3096163 RepID=UPI002FCB5988
MRKLGLTFAAALAATIAAAPASAATVTVGSVNSTVNNAGTVQDFSGFAANSFLAPNVQVLDASVANVGKRPSGSTGNYLAVLGGGEYTYTLPTFAPVLSFIAGSIDTYNSVTLSILNLSTNTTITQLFTGSQFGNTNGSTDVRLTFDTGSSSQVITSALFKSTTNSFEIDNIVSAAPEPATWAMMILGFGFAGMGLRSSRRSRGKLALA